MILDLGLIDYSDALKLQRELVNKRLSGQISDSVIIAEHPSVFTIGRTGSRKNLLVKEEYLRSRGIAVIDADRGGDITFHSPGQIVIYPVIDLKERTQDLHKYLKSMEEVAINFLGRYGITGEKVPQATGVWVLNKKIAFIGIAAKNWVTYHGLSININNDTSFFLMINPCGIEGLKVTTLEEVLGLRISVNSAKHALLDEFNRVFGIEEARSLHEYEHCPAMA